MDSATRGNLLAAGQGAILLGGKRWLVRQPTDQDTATIGLFLTQRLKDQKRELPPVDEKFGQILADELQTVEGVRFLAWLLLHDGRNGKPTEAEIDAAIHKHSRADYFRRLEEESGMAALGNSDGRPG